MYLYVKQNRNYLCVEQNSLIGCDSSWYFLVYFLCEIDWFQSDQAIRRKLEHSPCKPRAWCWNHRMSGVIHSTVTSLPSSIRLDDSLWILPCQETYSDHTAPWWASISSIRLDDSILILPYRETCTVTTLPLGGPLSPPEDCHSQHQRSAAYHSRNEI